MSLLVRFFSICIMFIWSGLASAHSCTDWLRAGETRTFILNTFPELETAHLRLITKLNFGQIVALHQFMDEPDIRDAFETSEVRKSFLSNLSNGVIALSDDLFVVNFLMVDKKSGQPVGAFGLMEFTGNGSISVGYFLTSKFRGRGLVNEALDAIIKFIENQTGPRTFFTLINADNIASQKVIQRSGFVFKHEDGKDQFYLRDSLNSANRPLHAEFEPQAHTR